MRKIITFLMVFSAFYCITVDACMNLIDSHSAGVVFNNNEGLFPDRFDSIGTNGINFYKDCMMIDVSGVKEVLMLSSTSDPLINNDPVTITGVTIVNNLLSMEVNYGGGCAAHEFKLYANDNLTKSIPPEVTLELSHNASGDDCKALISETITFNLLPFKKVHYNSSPLFLNILFPQGSSGRTVYKVLWYPDNTCSIKYRSHFDPNSMVYIEYQQIYNTTQKFPSIKIVTDTSVQYIKAFDYGKAITTELKWLMEKKIINGITEKKLTLIEESMIKGQCQYWTLQDTLLDYSSFYTGTVDKDGNLKWGDVMSVKSRCSSELEFKLPPNSIDGSTFVSPLKPASRIAGNEFSVKMTNGRCIVTLNKNAPTNAYIGILDLRGRVISKFAVPGNELIFALPFSERFPKGMYQVVYNANGSTKVSKLIVF
jgi:hypothetical protein